MPDDAERGLEQVVAVALQTVRRRKRTPQRSCMYSRPILGPSGVQRQRRLIIQESHLAPAPRLLVLDSGCANENARTIVKNRGDSQTRYGRNFGRRRPSPGHRSRQPRANARRMKRPPASSRRGAGARAATDRPFCRRRRRRRWDSRTGGSVSTLDGTRRHRPRCGGVHVIPTLPR